MKSIMHYFACSNAKDGNPTKIIPIPPAAARTYVRIPDIDGRDQEDEESSDSSLDAAPKNRFQEEFGQHGRKFESLSSLH